MTLAGHAPAITTATAWPVVQAFTAMAVGGAAGQRLSAHHVDGTGRVGRPVVPRGWHHARLEPKHARHQLDHAATGPEMAEGCFRRGDRHIAELGDDRGRLGAVHVDGGKAVSVDVAHVGDREASRLAGRPERLPAANCR